MIQDIRFSAESARLLRARELSDTEIADFSALIQTAKQQEGSAKQFLASLSHEEKELVRKANSLADPIQTANVSEEGAINLFRQPDSSDSVDLNNDGIVEVGIERTIQFPPANAPQWVKNAWDKATEGMDWGTIAIEQLNMHFAIYGIEIDGVNNKTALPPSQQWSQSGIQGLFDDLYSSLAFSVNLEGWTEKNKSRLGLYERFENALGKTNSDQTLVAQAGQGIAFGAIQAEAPEFADENPSKSDRPVSNDKVKELNNLLLYARLGVDKQKLDKIEEKMAEVENDPSLSKEQKYKMLQALEQQRQEVIEEAQRRTIEQEKRKALLGNLATTDENLKEQSLKSLLGR